MRAIFLAIAVAFVAFPADANDPLPNGAAVGMAKRAAEACDGIAVTPLVAELERKSLQLTAEQQKWFAQTRAVSAADFSCQDPIPGISCKAQNLSKCGKAIQLVGPSGWLTPGLLAVTQASPFAKDMPPPPPKEEPHSGPMPPPPTKNEETAEDKLLWSSIYAMFERENDRTHGLPTISGPPHNDITVMFTADGAATPSQLINVAADAAIKIGDLVLARKLDLKDRRLRMQMAIQSRDGSLINTFIVSWPAANVLQHAQKVNGRAALALSGRLEEIWGRYWTAVCSNLPRPELFVADGDMPEHPLDLENPANRDLSCKRRAGSELRVGR